MKTREQNNRLISSSLTDGIIRLLAAHPYLWAFAACILIHPFYLGAESNVPPNATLIETLMTLAAGYLLTYYLYREKKLTKLSARLIACSYSLAVTAWLVMYSLLRTKGVVMLLAGFTLILAFYFNADTEKYKTQLRALVILAMSFMVKFYYVYYTSCYTRQNDVHAFGGKDGHAAYIEYLLFNHKLPDFDVRDVWQFCHPPLHHFICAMWIDINENIFGVSPSAARESLQTLSLFYSMCIVISAYRIFRMFRLNGAALYAPTIIVAFHPSFILLSGSINNDVLSAAFAMGAFLCTVRWYRGERFIDLMKIALCVGLGMMTKLQAALVAPPIAAVFLIVLIKKWRADRWSAYKTIGQFAAFGAVCVPLGLWFEIKNYIKFKVPFTYVQEMEPTARQFLGDKSFISRITDFSSKQLELPFEQWLSYSEDGMAVSYNEYNPLIALLKNSLYGESINQYTLELMPNTMGFSKALFWLGAALAAVCFVLMIVSMFTEHEVTPAEKTLFGGYYALLLCSFYKMSADYPYTCTMNFRYITPTVMIGAFFLGVTLKRLNESESMAAKAINAAAAVASGLFAFLTVYIYIFVCLPAPL